MCLALRDKYLHRFGVNWLCTCSRKMGVMLVIQKKSLQWKSVSLGERCEQFANDRLGEQSYSPELTVGSCPIPELTGGAGSFTPATLLLFATSLYTALVWLLPPSSVYSDIFALSLAFSATISKRGGYGHTFSAVLSRLSDSNLQVLRSRGLSPGSVAKFCHPPKGKWLRSSELQFSHLKKKWS